MYNSNRRLLILLWFRLAFLSFILLSRRCVYLPLKIGLITLKIIILGTLRSDSLCTTLMIQPNYLNKLSSIWQGAELTSNSESVSKSLSDISELSEPSSSVTRSYSSSLAPSLPDSFLAVCLLRKSISQKLFASEHTQSKPCIPLHHKLVVYLQPLRLNLDLLLFWHKDRLACSSLSSEI